MKVAEEEADSFKAVGSLEQVADLVHSRYSQKHQEGHQQAPCSTHLSDVFGLSHRQNHQVDQQSYCLRLLADYQRSLHRCSNLDQQEAGQVDRPSAFDLLQQRDLTLLVVHTYRIRLQRQGHHWLPFRHQN